MNTITSNQNLVIKEVKSLKLRKFREDKKLFCIEGVRFVEEAFKENIIINKVVISEIFSQSGSNILKEIEDKGYESYIVPDKLFCEMADTENPQGILAVVRMKDYKIEDILGKKSFIIILDSIQDPGNMGTIIRTADAAGATAVVLSKGCVDVYNPKVLRSTMGSIFHLPVVLSNNLEETISNFKSINIKICAAHLKADLNYFDVPMDESVAIIIGNEANGINDEIALMSDVLVKIPMVGGAESLNASVAASLLMYEVVRQRAYIDNQV